MEQAIYDHRQFAHRGLALPHALIKCPSYVRRLAPDRDGVWDGES